MSINENPQSKAWKKLTLSDEEDIIKFVSLFIEKGCSARPKKEGRLIDTTLTVPYIKQLMSNTQSDFFLYEDDDKAIILGFCYEQEKDIYQLLHVAAKYKSGQIGDQNWNKQLAEGLRLAGEKFREFIEERQKTVRIGWLGEAKNVNKAVFLVPPNWIPLLSAAFSGKGVKVTKSSRGNANYLDFELI